MQTAPFRRTVFLLLVVAVLTAPLASAAGGPDAERPTKTAGLPLELLGRVWDFLESAWSESGCHLDPDGRCAPAPQPQTDEGCHLDPDGGCGA